MDKEKAINCIQDLIDVANSHGSACIYKRNETFSELENVLACLQNSEPVIRCKDCDHCIVNENHPDKPLICTMTLMCGTTQPENFCWQGTPRVKHKPLREPSLKERWDSPTAFKFRGCDGRCALMDNHGVAIFREADLVEKPVESVDSLGGKNNE